MSSRIDDRIKETFDLVKADEDLKNSTKKMLARKTCNYGRFAGLFYRRLAPAAVCLSVLLLCMAGYKVYFTEKSVISIDINPSLELGINSFNRVISVTPFNDDGHMLEMSVNVKFMDYKDAVDKILDDEKISGLLTQDAVMSVVVIGTDEKQCKKMLSNVESCTSRHKNAFCYSVHSADVSEAHRHGLSYGKYCAFLELHGLNPDITEEDIMRLTMKEIQALIYDLSSGTSGNVQNSDCIKNGRNRHRGNSHHGNGQ